MLPPRLLETSERECAAAAGVPTPPPPTPAQTLISAMLASEGVGVEELAWDNPSPSSFGLLSKHFGLSEYVEQPNHFVLFKQYFEGR